MTRPSFKRMAATEAFSEEGLEVPAELEVGEAAASEELEATSAEAEVNEDAEVIEVIGEGVEDTEGDIEVLEGQEDMLEAVLEEEPSNENVGVDEVALESLHSILTMISRNRGFNLDSQRRRVAIESFEGRPVTRRQLALEALDSVKDTLKSIWEQIKSALRTIWAEVKKFWSKHVSTLGRLKKAYDSAKKKINAQKGSLDLSKEIKAPGAMKRAFPGTDAITAATITGMMETHSGVTGNGKAIITAAKNFANSLKTVATSPEEDAIEKAVAKVSEGNFNLGTEDNPLLGGFYGTVVFDKEEGENGKTKIKVKFDKNKVEDDSKQDGRELEPGSKNQLTGIVTKALALITTTQSLAKDTDVEEKAYNAVLKDLDKEVNDADGTDDSVKRQNVRDATRQFRLATSVAPQVSSKIASLNVSLLKLGLAFINTSLSHHKKVSDK